jgi:hypothetical protein
VQQPRRGDEGEGTREEDSCGALPAEAGAGLHTLPTSLSDSVLQPPKPPFAR